MVTYTTYCYFSRAAREPALNKGHGPCHEKVVGPCFNAGLASMRPPREVFAALVHLNSFSNTV